MKSGSKRMVKAYPFCRRLKVCSTILHFAILFHPYISRLANISIIDHITWFPDSSLIHQYSSFAPAIATQTTKLPKPHITSPRKNLTNDDRRKICKIREENPTIKEREIGGELT